MPRAHGHIRTKRILERQQQAGWGAKKAAVFDDVAQIQFSPAAFSHPFDVSVDQLELRAS